MVLLVRQRAAVTKPALGGPSADRIEPMPHGQPMIQKLRVENGTAKPIRVKLRMELVANGEASSLTAEISNFGVP